MTIKNVLVKGRVAIILLCDLVRISILILGYLNYAQVACALELALPLLSSVLLVPPLDSRLKLLYVLIALI